jgi:hypothetical protein
MYSAEYKEWVKAKRPNDVQEIERFTYALAAVTGLSQPTCRPERGKRRRTSQKPVTIVTF